MSKALKFALPIHKKNGLPRYYTTRIKGLPPATSLIPIYVSRWKESILSLPKKLLGSTNVPYGKSSGSDDQYTDSAVPKLPLPELNDTMERYLDTMQPILTTAQHDRLKKIVKDFTAPNSIGPKLQLYLKNRSEKLENWAYEYWLNDMYLANADALPVNSNPGMVLPPRHFTTILDLARFTARLLDAALDYKDVLDKRTLPVEKMGQHPTCMVQFYRLLTTYRLPGKPIDKHLVLPPPPTSGSTAEHVIVICRNQLYCLPIKAADRGRLTEDEMCAQLMLILDDAPNLPSPPPVGILTASGRHHWADSREALIYNEKNRRNLDLIQKCLLIVCLDEPLPASFNSRMGHNKGHKVGQRDETNMMCQMLHGGGSNLNSANRWFDKTVQLIICNDGTVGFCYEHSVAEGGPPISFVEQIYAHADSKSKQSPAPPPNTSSHLPPPERIEWVLEANNHKHIQEAAAVVDKLAKNLDFQVYRFTNYGKDFIKSCKVSPDVYIQLAMQLAYYRLYGHLVATYESASTRRFRMGRVDSIRAVHPEGLKWVKAMTQAEPTGAQQDQDAGKKDQEKVALFQEAVKKQTKVMNENISGYGIDIHLLGLREAAKETSPTAAHPLPEIFTDETFKIANAFLLSTSQIATPIDDFMGYGPVVPDGYGCSYNPKKNAIIFCISSFHSSDKTSSAKFAQSLEDSLNTMYALLSRIKK